VSEGTLLIVLLLFGFVAEQNISPLQGGICLLGHSRPGRPCQQPCLALLRKRERLRPVSSPAQVGPQRRVNACYVRFPTLRCSQNHDSVTDIQRK
jgi:hypothetical protein